MVNVSIIALKKWNTALKEWNTKKGGTWCVPRKGSKDYKEVRKIMDGIRGDKPKKEVKTKKEVKPKKVVKTKSKPTKPKPVVKPKPKPETKTEKEELKQGLTLYIKNMEEIKKRIDLRSFKKLGGNKIGNLKKIVEEFNNYQINKQNSKWLKILKINEDKYAQHKDIAGLVIKNMRIEKNIIKKINNLRTKILRGEL